MGFYCVRAGSTVVEYIVGSATKREEGLLNLCLDVERAPTIRWLPGMSILHIIF